MLKGNLETYLAKDKALGPDEQLAKEFRLGWSNSGNRASRGRDVAYWLMEQLHLHRFRNALQRTRLGHIPALFRDDG